MNRASRTVLAVIAVMIFVVIAGVGYAYRWFG
jgi:NADH:ubiquinone oxidoreductase subunit 3 (subunit A)